MPRNAGRHFLQIPGPTNVPDRVLRAIDFPTMDHRSPDFAALGKGCLAGMKRVFKSTQGEVVIYPASGTGAWEAALVNTLSAGDRVLMAETGHFATLWQKLAARARTGSRVPARRLAPWRRPRGDREAPARRRRASASRRSAWCTTKPRPAWSRASQRCSKAIDASGHPALLMVDTISSLASLDYRHDEWGVDVTVAGSQKGLMLPPGLSFNCISAKALAASKTARLPRSYWAWDEMLSNGKTGYFPYTPATNLLYGLREALDHAARRGRPRRRVRAAPAPRRSDAPRGARLGPRGARARSARVLRLAHRGLCPPATTPTACARSILEAFDMSLGTGLGKLAGKVFRIGHLGDFNDLTLMGTLAGVEMGLGARRRAGEEGRRASGDGVSCREPRAATSRAAA